jgi:hypothetical protein
MTEKTRRADPQAETGAGTGSSIDTGRTPGAAGHPEPGSGHDDAVTTTVAEGPAQRKTDAVGGAFGDEVETDPLAEGRDEIDTAGTDSAE